MSTNQITIKGDRKATLQRFEIGELKNAYTRFTICKKLTMLDWEMNKDLPKELPF